MNSRLQPLMLNEEDRLIMLAHCVRHDTPDKPRDCICSFYAEADCRDADLMWNAQNHPIICATYTVEGERVELRAWRTSMRRAGVRL